MNKKYPFRPAIITGIVVGVFAILSFSIVDSLNRSYKWGVNPATIRGLTGLATIIILAIGIYTGMQSIRRSNNGCLAYSQALKAGVFIAVITAVIVSVFGFVYVSYINPGYKDYMVSEGKKFMIAEGQNAAQVSANIADLQKQFSTGTQVVQSLVGQSVAGTIISLIMALFIRTKK